MSGPPTYAEIAEAIVIAQFTNEAQRSDTNIRNVENRSDHLKRALRNAGGTENARGKLTVALTAMHGVGGALGKELLTRAGFRASLVPEQAQPAPYFPQYPPLIQKMTQRRA